MDGTLLNNKINSCKLSIKEIAESLGLTRQGFYNKLNGKREFKGSEIKKLSSLLNLSPQEKESIFLPIV